MSVCEFVFCFCFAIQGGHEENREEESIGGEDKVYDFFNIIPSNFSRLGREWGGGDVDYFVSSVKCI